MDIEAAVKYPMNDEDEWVKTILIGGSVSMLSLGLIFVTYIITILTFGIGAVLIPFAAIGGILISVVILGYVIEVMRRTIRGNDTPPRFSDVGELIKDGLYGMAIGIVYQLPLLVLGGAMMALMFVMFGASAFLESDAAAAGTTLVFFALFGVGSLFLMAYSLGVGYLMPASLCAYAHEGSIGAAFDYDRIKEVALSKEYAVAFAVAFGINLVASQVMQFLMIVLVGFFVQFYVAVVYGRIISEGYADALDLPASPGPEADQWTDTGNEPTVGDP